MQTYMRGEHTFLGNKNLNDYTRAQMLSLFDPYSNCSTVDLLTPPAWAQFPRVRLGQQYNSLIYIKSSLCTAELSYSMLWGC